MERAAYTKRGQRWYSKYGTKLADAAVWSPEAVVAGSNGWWFAPGLAGVLYQDTLGTTPAVSTSDRVALWNAGGTSGMAFSQAVEANRATLQAADFDGTPSVSLDGTAGSMEAALAGGAGPADCSIFVTINTADTSFILMSAVGERYLFTAEPGGGTLAGDVGGSATFFVDGVEVFERGDLLAASSGVGWVVVEARNLQLAAWPSIVLGYLALTGGVHRFNGRFGRMLCIETADLLPGVREEAVAWLRKDFPA